MKGCWPWLRFGPFRQLFGFIHFTSELAAWYKIIPEQKESHLVSLVFPCEWAGALVEPLLWSDSDNNHSRYSICFIDSPQEDELVKLLHRSLAFFLYVVGLVSHISSCQCVLTIKCTSSRLRHSVIFHMWLFFPIAKNTPTKFSRQQWNYSSKNGIFYK